MSAGDMPLLRTKLDVPPPRAHTLARERLLALVPQALGTRLVLLSAPAGFGKTTFLASWCRSLAARGAAVAWLALDEDDNDPARFLAYLRAAIEPLGESSGDEAAWPAAADSALALTRLVNRLAAIERDTVLVLDDYHLIRAPAIHSAIAFLLDHLPGRVCLAIGSRADPPLQLARLRAREQLIELRAAHLRFTPEEVRGYVRIASDLSLTPEEAQAVAAYAEGWPAGVQLIALALHPEARELAATRGPAQSIQHSLTQFDSQRHVFAYLADDVFKRQPPHLKSFLLQTAILDRMCAPLCDAVLGLGGWDVGLGQDCPSPAPLVPSPSDSYSRLILEELERANLFVIPLDHERRWYRYHHLFHAFLRARLDCEPPGALADLHRRASAWLERHQLPAGAVEHALAAGDTSQAAELIEAAATGLIERGEYAGLQGWLKQFPERIRAQHPALELAAAWAALLAGEVERVEPLLQRAERAWQPSGEEPRPGEAAHLRAHLARLRSDAPAAICAAQEALAQLGEDARTLRAGSLLELGAGQLLAGDLGAAGASLQAAYAACQAHNFLGMLAALRCLGDLAAQRGQLGEATRRYHDAIAAAGDHAVWERWAAAVRLGDLARERNDLDGALERLQAAMSAAEQAGVEVYLPDGYIALARTLAARQDYGGADLALDRAAHAAQRLGAPACAAKIRAYRARLALARGDQAAPEEWRDQLASDLESSRCYEREVEALTLARVLIAQGRGDPSRQPLAAAHTLLERLRQSAAAEGRTGSLIEIAAISALALAAARQADQALRQLHDALKLAAAEGYARVFLDEGAPMAGLLLDARRRGIMPEYVDKLLAALREGLGARDMGLDMYAQAPSPKPQAPLIEPLSERELEVLRLIAGGSSNQAIAAKLVISLGTVKSHINHILGKLAACNRTEAVACARDLGLLPIEQRR